jgi:hypothetical protein
MTDVVLEALIGLGELTLIMGVSALAVAIGYIAHQAFFNKKE